jgi:hypothetical protein
MTESNNNMLMQSLVSDLSVAFDSLNSKNDAGAELPIQVPKISWSLVEEAHNSLHLLHCVC